MVQNADGGWGETCGTYDNSNMRGEGPSTASQTAGALLGHQWDIAGIDLVRCSEVVCRLPEKSGRDLNDDGSGGPNDDSGGGDVHHEDRVYVEADGELLGRLPARMTMVPDALSLVVPA